MVTLYRHPIDAYRHRLGKVQPGLVTHRLRSGVSLTVDSGPADIRVINEIWVGRAYGAFVPSDGWTVVDLGANKGVYSAWVLHHAPHAIVQAYEPDPHNFACLARNVPTVEAFHAAVGAQAGVVTLHQVPRARALSSILPDRLHQKGTHETVPVTVPMVSLVDVVNRVGRPIDLLKMDVEGAEYEIILRSPDAAFAPIHRLLVEYDAVSPHDPHITGRDLATRLRGLGFEVDEGLEATAAGARILSARRSDSGQTR